MKLLELKLTNFKGVRDYTLTTDGKDVAVYGDNETGKTTLMDAFLWLLYGKDSLNRADFDIKTRDPISGETLHGLDHTVSALLEVNGEQITLEKTYSEQWTKKRGQAHSTLTGHTNDYSINGVPVKQNEYSAAIKDIADEQVFKLLTSPTYFNEQLHWKERRNLLLEVVGDVSDEDVIASDASLASLAGIIAKRSLEDHKKVVAARRAEINKELQRIPTRIDEVHLGMNDIAGIDAATLDRRLEEASASKKELEEQLLRIKSGGEVAELCKQVAETETEISELKSRMWADTDKKALAVRSEIMQTIGEKSKKEQALRAAGGRMEDAKIELKRAALRMEALRGEWEEYSAKEFVANVADTCPTCGQPLPADEVEAAIEKAQAAFNLAIAKKADAINTEGKAQKSITERRKIDIEMLEAEIEFLQDDIDDLQAKHDALQAELKELVEGKVKAEDDAGYIALVAKKEALQTEVVKVQKDRASAEAEVVELILNADKAIRAVIGEQKSLDTHAKSIARVEELKEQERRLSAEYEENEQETFLMEEFMRRKVAILEDKINSKFKMARFRMFEVQVNGALNEVCETTYKGVPYSGGLNNAHRIKVGLDIINVLGEHYGLTAPVFIDNAESVTVFDDVASQVITLYVSEKDKTLRTEVVK